MEIKLIDRPARPSLVRNWIAYRSREISKSGMTCNPKLRGTIVGEFNKRLGYDILRKLVFGWLFGDGEPMSSKELEPAQILALRDWIGWFKVGDEWVVNPNYKDELFNVLQEALANFANKHGLDLDGAIMHSITAYGAEPTEIQVEQEVV